MAQNYALPQITRLTLLWCLLLLMMLKNWKW